MKEIHLLFVVFLLYLFTKEVLKFNVLSVLPPSCLLTKERFVQVEPELLEMKSVPFASAMIVAPSAEHLMQLHNAADAPV